MEEVNVIRTHSQAVSHAAKSPSVSLSARSGRSESSANQTARVSEEGPVNITDASLSQKNVSLAEVSAAVQDINRQLDLAQHTLRFYIDDATEELKVQVVDKETGEVIRTIPPEPSLSLLASGNFSGLFSVQG